MTQLTRDENERTRRVGENEALFRTVNDQVRDLDEQFHLAARQLSVICECGRVSCHDRLELPAREYEAVREDATLFLIRPGHDAPDVEDVVERHESHWIVRKHEGAPAELARRANTR